LLFTLPAGVVTDRFDRKKLIVATDVVRGLVTALNTMFIFHYRSSFSHIKNPVNAFHGSSTTLLLTVIMVSTFLLGSAEVLGNNSSQTFLPEVVETDLLQQANGQMWTAEYLTNSFVGPALGSLLLGISIYIPFLFDAGSFFASAALIAIIATQARKITKPKRAENVSAIGAFNAELREGFRWLMGHKLLRPMAFTLGALNFISSLMFAAFILYSQEVLHVTVFIFAILSTAGALGGALGGWLGPRIVKKIGDGSAITMFLTFAPILYFITFFIHQWFIFYVLMFIETMGSVLWNIVTVSFRQTIIPNQLLGRVNSGYRFFGWGSMPLGSLVGGLIVKIAMHFTSRQLALRIPFLVATVLGILVYLLTRNIFSTETLQAARDEAKG
jgi:MFS family permease